MNNMIRKIKLPIVAIRTAIRLLEDDLILAAPEGEGIALGDEGVIWTVGAG